MERSAILSPRQRNLKRLARRLIEKVGGVEAAANFCRAGKSQLSDYQNPNVCAFMPQDVIEDLEAVAGEAIVSRALATEAGYLLVAKPAAVPADADWCSALGDAVQEFNDVSSGLLRAMPGGVTAAELLAADIRGQIAEAMERLACLDALAERALEAD